MESLYDAEKLLFTYDGIADSNPNPGYNLEKFWREQFIAVEFNIYSINFMTKSNPTNSFFYIFYLQSVYLTDEDKIRSILKKKKQDPNN